MQKFDHRSLIYGTIGIQERVLVRQGKEPSGLEPLKLCCNMVHVFDKFHFYFQFDAFTAAYRVVFLGDSGKSQFYWFGNYSITNWDTSDNRCNCPTNRTAEL